MKVKEVWFDKRYNQWLIPKGVELKVLRLGLFDFKRIIVYES